MNPLKIRSLLFSCIDDAAANSRLYCYNPKSDFTRNRKLPFSSVMKGIIGLQSGSLSNEIIDMFDSSVNAPSVSALVQQRSKISPAAFETVFRSFSADLAGSFDDDMYVLAVDGSSIQIPTNASDPDSFFPGTNDSRPYNMLHLNALYDLKHHIYHDAVIQKSHMCDEHYAFTAMIDRSSIPEAIVIADRGYESYNNLAHIQEKGWFFLIRIKDGEQGIKSGLNIPDSEMFDTNFSLNLTRKQTNKTKELLKDKNNYRFVSATSRFDYLPVKNRKKDPTVFYTLNFRLIRFPITEETYETVITNLPKDKYSVRKIKELYASRWGIETSFRYLKHTLGMMYFHSKKVMCVQQEVYAHLIMYNFAEMTTSHVVIEKKQRKYTYKANFSVAVHICRLFCRGKATSPEVEAMIGKNLSPIRPDRTFDRKQYTKPAFQSFIYRVA